MKNIKWLIVLLMGMSLQASQDSFSDRRVPMEHFYDIQWYLVNGQISRAPSKNLGLKVNMAFGVFMGTCAVLADYTYYDSSWGHPLAYMLVLGKYEVNRFIEYWNKQEINSRETIIRELHQKREWWRHFQENRAADFQLSALLDVRWIEKHANLL